MRITLINLKPKRGVAIEIRTPVCEIFLNRSACTRTHFSGLRFGTSDEGGIKIKEAQYLYSLPQHTGMFLGSKTEHRPKGWQCWPEILSFDTKSVADSMVHAEDSANHTTRRTAFFRLQSRRWWTGLVIARNSLDGTEFLPCTLTVYLQIVPYLSCSVASLLFCVSLFCSSCCVVDAVLTCPVVHPWTQSLHDVHILATFSSRQELLTVLQRSLYKIRE